MSEHYNFSAKQRWWATEQSRAARDVVMKRSKARCEDCGCRLGRRLGGAVHHLHYSSFGREDPLDLVRVCESCHDVRHIDPDGNRISDPKQCQLIWERWWWLSSHGQPPINCGRMPDAIRAYQRDADRAWREQQRQQEKNAEAIRNEDQRWEKQEEVRNEDQRREKPQYVDAIEDIDEPDRYEEIMIANDYEFKYEQWSSGERVEPETGP